MKCDVPALLAVESVSKAVMPLNQSTSGVAQNYSISNSTTSPSTPSSSVRKLSLSKNKNKKRSIPESPVVDKSPLSSLPSQAVTDVNQYLSTPSCSVHRLSLSKNKKRFSSSAPVVDGSTKTIMPSQNPTFIKRNALRDQTEMHPLIDGCYDSQESLSRVLSMDVNLPENVNKPYTDNIKKQFVPNAKFKDEMYSSGSSNNSISLKLPEKKENPGFSSVEVDSFKDSSLRKDASGDQKRMYGVVDNCFDSQEFLSPGLEKDRHSKQMQGPKEDKAKAYTLPNEKIKDAVVSSGSSCNSVSLSSSKALSSTERSKTSRSRQSEEKKQQIRERDRLRK